MKNSKLLFFIQISFFLAFMFLPVLVFAQGPDPDAPIDGGLSLLLAAGAAYGVKKYRDGRKVKNNEEPDVK